MAGAASGEFRARARALFVEDRMAKHLTRPAFSILSICFFSLLTAAGLPLAGEQPLEASRLVLQNQALKAVFQVGEPSPGLAAVEYLPTGEVYPLEGSQEVVMALLRPEVIHDPDLEVVYQSPGGFRFAGAETGEDEKRLVLRFVHDFGRVEVTYELDPEFPVLDKTLTYYADPGGGYVAGLRLWSFQPRGLKRAWPLSAESAAGQPAVFLRKNSGCAMTLEWPNSELLEDGARMQIGYRPGQRLLPSQSHTFETGSILLFPKQGNEESASLETARLAFFDHVARRVQPNIPFPVKFTTWGPWLTATRADRILQAIDDIQWVGTELLHFDAGWQWPDRPYSTRLPGVHGADDKTWDLAVTQPERVPNGMLPLVRAIKDRGMKLSVWLDSLSTRYVRESTEWAVINREGNPHLVGRPMAELRYGDPKGPPVQSLSSPYGDVLKGFALELLDRYDLGGILFDFHRYTPNYSTTHESLANGYDSVDIQIGKMLDIYDEIERRRPGIYRFYCKAVNWPWVLKHATHLHAGDPGLTELMTEASGSDYPARALALERRIAWQRFYDGFVPPWGIKGDIAGWSLQQRSPIPVNLEHTGLLIPSGEGWTQNMFTCFATTAVRDIRFSFAQMPAFDKEVLREWLAWDKLRSRFVLNCRPVVRQPETFNKGLAAYSHVGEGRGVIYAFNNSFDLNHLEVRLDESAGFRPTDRNLPVHLVYPVKANLGQDSVSYGQTLRLPIIGKDSVVIEIGLGKPDEIAPYSYYEAEAGRVVRSFQPLFLLPLDEMVSALGKGSFRLEVGDSLRDRSLAASVLDSLGVVMGRRISIDHHLAIPPDQADALLIIGSNEGLAHHEEIGNSFQQILYNQYIEWDGRLYSAPLAARLSERRTPTFCLIAPRPEQLEQLSHFLVSDVLSGASRVTRSSRKQAAGSVEFSAEIPDSNRAALYFQSVVHRIFRQPLPSDLDFIRFEVRAEAEGRRQLIWTRNVPPFIKREGGPELPEDHVISVADLAGKRVNFSLTADFVDGRKGVRMNIGFRDMGVLIPAE